MSESVRKCQNVEESARKRAIDDINRKLKTSYNRVSSGYKKLGLESPDIAEFQYGYTGPNEGKSAVGFRASDYLEQLKALEGAKALGVDITGLGTASVPAINAAITKFNENKAELKRLKLKKELQQEREDLWRQQQAANQAQLAHSEKMLDKRLLSSDKQGLRTQELAILQAQNQAADRRDNADFRRMQQLYNNRRLDMEQENLSHKNKMQTIATLMQGLQGVANAGRQVMPPRSYYTL